VREAKENDCWAMATVRKDEIRESRCGWVSRGRGGHSAVMIKEFLGYLGGAVPTGRLRLESLKRQIRRAAVNKQRTWPYTAVPRVPCRVMPGPAGVDTPDAGVSCVEKHLAVAE